MLFGLLVFVLNGSHWPLIFVEGLRGRRLIIFSVVITIAYRTVRLRGRPDRGNLEFSQHNADQLNNTRSLESEQFH